MTWSEEIIQKVWEKGQTVPSLDPNVIRKDRFGAMIIRQYYDDKDIKYGWGIECMDPDSFKIVEDLQPLQWDNLILEKNREKDVAIACG
ncbi:MAG: hypothetical protein A2268_07960 [Candidatus Raymondbacteria bacterium RifOxyA12_full_50_37]|uniref:Uncharacterized protein n=1 Tax=Candidatus Raymondbacteria bacterium RIFOXYD12_FULL_49_13 TaxID=1817890 RepID=A0A1F7FJN0_UNCRA|nr:MAG: hypothetical protein A2350_13150 [Candidatus Raymondbacteria bacterium RifOxyB12_full_50_8]OGJ91742.1 MAG: hypothetical protein A2268_07960 [Candidatus Raymondbacteria bacterium RifOxyA12_full_50_37]OGJ93502.1 MAG: hypothetical protein A2248_09005 [Candidatus Raymondbacteria bacterium RIFOXYA2_FULL_49_16]OGJ98772.1 MAG: hypothetical protein A2453_09815 [Candidatus Raymondbacteria bacterium RIFOXYC2_FULL_50_21]OGK06934.1 MAG: hypothetical protein A2519_05820 [Candidatus Raymondbacteria b